MSEPALRLMTIADYLAWDDGTDTRYELVDGVPVAMNPPMVVHQRVGVNIVGLIERAVSDRRPCRAVTQPGVLIAGRSRANAWVPDVVMTCEPIDDRPLLEAPILVVEILSPSTRRFDATDKVVYYGRIPSVQEIWLVNSRKRGIFVFERRDGEWHAGLPHIGKASFTSRVLGRDISLDELYELTPLADFAEDEP